MARYSVVWLSSTGPGQDVECTATTARIARMRGYSMIGRLKLPHETVLKLLDWFTKLDIRPSKKRSLVLTFEKAIPCLGRLCIYCYKGDGR